MSARTLGKDVTGVWIRLTRKCSRRETSEEGEEDSGEEGEEESGEEGEEELDDRDEGVKPEFELSEIDDTFDDYLREIYDMYHDFHHYKK